jgi:hypothetical protein
MVQSISNHPHPVFGFELERALLLLVVVEPVAGFDSETVHDIVEVTEHSSSC